MDGLLVEVAQYGIVTQRGVCVCVCVVGGGRAGSINRSYITELVDARKGRRQLKRGERKREGMEFLFFICFLPFLVWLLSSFTSFSLSFLPSFFRFFLIFSLLSFPFSLKCLCSSFLSSFSLSFSPSPSGRCMPCMAEKYASPPFSSRQTIQQPTAGMRALMKQNLIKSIDTFICP